MKILLRKHTQQKILYGPENESESSNWILKIIYIYINREFFFCGVCVGGVANRLD